MRDYRPRSRSAENIEHPVDGFSTGKTVATGSGVIERRGKCRVDEPFPARIWGVDSGDLPFNIYCLLDNISSTGLFFHMPRQIELGREVRLIVHLLTDRTTGATVTVSGKIVRVEPQDDGNHGFAVGIKGCKFL